MSISAEVFASYLESQKELVEFEDVDQTSCLVSLPLHFSSHTRVELAVTQLSTDQFVLTDQGQTLGELKDAGYPIGRKLLDRVREIIRIWGVELVGVTLIRTCHRRELGRALQEAGEAAKTVGDAYLTIRDRETDRRVEESIKDQVRKAFLAERYFYREQQTVPGTIEKGHMVDFYIPSNGSNGLALEVLTKPNKLQAEAWGFRARDMKDANQKLLVGFVYDATAKDLSRTILKGIADIALPSSELIAFASELKAHRISRGDAPIS